MGPAGGNLQMGMGGIFPPDPLPLMEGFSQEAGEDADVSFLFLHSRPSPLSSHPADTWHFKVCEQAPSEAPPLLPTFASLQGVQSEQAGDRVRSTVLKQERARLWGLRV